MAVSKLALVLAGAILFAACGGSTEDGFNNCALGELTGSWHFQYTEIDGTCGQIGDDTGVPDPEGSVLPTECTYSANDISADQCRWDLSWTCPTGDNAGTQ